ncbi:hypothetical protein PMI30_03706 [Pseudomonas sp. GM50]|uniref:hypothetical protein n=1 Tax=Pseudomonas sp. GM50 TaxID=1144332 RepID=UPI000270CF38|nr:hypothetical protein [Pseudomonas sp. GM50]EJM64355.1 hypothetical protein PMI30_03706 [Pseudomonas sp. GM50]
MNKKEAKAKIKDLLSSGVPKSEVFTQLSGQGVKDSLLANLIASTADPYLCLAHDRKVNVIITLMFIQAAFALLIGFSMGSAIGPNARWVVGGLGALIPLLFAWGFYNHLAGAYNAYIVLSIVPAVRQLEGLTSGSISTLIGSAIGIGMLVFVCYVRQKLFPDLVLFTPKKIKGRYVFSS